MRRLEWQKSDLNFNNKLYTNHVLMLLDTAGSHKRAGLLQCVELHMYEDTGTYEYIHFNQDIPHVLCYPHMRLEDAKAAALTTVRLCCDLEVGNA